MDVIRQPHLDTVSTVPLYRQLFEHFSSLIQSGLLASGERLPATRELAGSLGLNRTTVAAAYELLESEGFITGQVGRGSFVTVQRPATDGHPLDWSDLLRHANPSPQPLAPSPLSKGVSFATSRPSEQLFPLDDLRASCQEVMASPDFAHILQLGSPSGYEPLRRYLLEAARAENLAAPDNDLIVTNGCQQSLDLLARVLLRPGDKVVVEDPVYPGLKSLFLEAGAQLIGVPVGADGIEIEPLQAALDRERPRLIVVTSNFQNPTGATLPVAARAALLRAAQNAGVPLIENDIYGDLRYSGDDLPPIKHSGDAGHVILLRSFSKITFPGLRVGWVLGPRALIARLAQSKQLADLHTDQLSQAVLLRFAESGRMAAHLAHMLRAGAERLAAVLAACDRYLPAGSRFTRPRGGMNLWVRLPEPLDAGELLARAQRENVSYLPGKYFAVSRFDPGSLRLSFAGLTPDEIRKGLATLGAIFSAELERTRSNAELDPAPAMV
ncbi:MAG: PLP-dependent aminotransferase family protein [Bryobacteraceae bacterium]